VLGYKWRQCFSILYNGEGCVCGAHAKCPHQEAVPFSRIVEALTRLNKSYDEDEDSIPKERTRKKFPAMYKKCSAYKFWLFAEVGHVVVEDLKRLL